MSKKLIFHIGSGKSGSTTIQNFLWKNVGRLNLQNFYFADFLGPHSQIWLPFLCFDEDNPRVSYALPFLSEDEDAQNYLTREKSKINKISHLYNWIYALPDDANIVFSCEWLFDLKKNEIEKFKKIFNLGIDVELIIYLREPISHLLSAWTQHVCNGFYEEMMSPIDFLTGQNSNLFDYKNHIENWEFFFPGCINVRRFDRKFLVGEDVLLDFAHASGINWDEYFYHPPELNKRISWEAQKILAAVNLIEPTFFNDGSINKRRDNIVDFFHGVGDPNSKYIPSYEEVLFMKNYFSDYNSWLKKKYFSYSEHLWDTKIDFRESKFDEFYSIKLSRVEMCAAELIVKIFNLRNNK